MKNYIISGIFIFIPLLVFNQVPQWKIYNPSNSQIPWNKIKSMDFDKNGHLWAGYDNSGNVPHLTEFDGDTFKNYIYDAWVNAVEADNDGDIWFTTSNMELYKYNGNFQIYTNALISSPWMEPLFVDKTKNVWIADKTNYFILKFNGSAWSKYDYTNSVVKNTIFLCLSGFRYDLMIGTKDSGMIQLSANQSKVYDKSNSPLPSNSVYAMKEGNGDTLWFVCPGNLGYFTGTNWNFYPKSNLASANSIQLDSKGNIWISNPDFTNGGVFMFDRKNWTVYNKSNSPLPTNQLLDLKIDKNDNIWVATWGSGLAKLSPYTSSVSEVKPLTLKCTTTEKNLNLFLPEIDVYHIEIISVSGKTLYLNPEAFGDYISIDISGFPSGVYIVRVANDQSAAYSKILKP